MSKAKFRLGYLFSFAIKNLMRYKKRTIITASAIAYGLLMFLLIDGMLTGADKDSERNLIWYETGSARIYNKEYWENRDKVPVKYTIDNPGEIMKALEDRNIKAAPRITFGAEMIIYEDPYPESGNKFVRAVGVDLEKDGRVFQLQDKLDEGRFPKAGEFEVVIGSWLAKDIGAKVGYPITVSTRTKNGFVQTFDVEIVGILTTPNPIVNKGTLMMPIDIVDEMLLMEGSVTEITMAFSEIGNIDKQLVPINKLIADISPTSEVLSWKVLGADYLAIAAAKRQGTSSIIGLVFLIALIGISNTMLMSLYERRREIGTMRALGMTDFEVMISFLFEAGGIGLLGGILGVILGIGANFYMVNYGIDFTGMIGDMDIGYRIAAEFKSMWVIPSYFLSVVLGFGLSVIIAIFPTRKALKVTITECLRAE